MDQESVKDIKSSVDCIIKSVCDICSECFTSNRDFTHHLNTNHSEGDLKKALECIVCKKFFSSKFELVHHVDKEHLQKQKVPLIVETVNENEVLEIKDSGIAEGIKEGEKEYNEKTWKDHKNETQGVSYTGKTRTFIKAVKEIKQALLNNDKEHTINGIKYEISHSKNVPYGTEIEFEVKTEDKNGKACVRFYGPNTKKVCKINVAKTKGYDGIFVESVSEVVKNLLDQNISGKGWKVLLKTENESKSKPGTLTDIKNDNHRSKSEEAMSKSIYQCPFCAEIVDSNEGEINIHMREHAETNPQCDICAEICKDKDHKKKHQRDCKARSQKFHDGVTVTPGPKRSRPADLLETEVHCQKCEFVTNYADVFKRHMRDEHITLNASTSPPKKKSDQDKLTLTTMKYSEQMDESDEDIYETQMQTILKLLENVSFEENKLMVKHEMDNEEVQIMKGSEEGQVDQEEILVVKETTTRVNLIEKENKDENLAGGELHKETEVPPNLKENKLVNEVVKDDIEDKRITTHLWQKHFNVCRANSDGRCGAHCIAAKIYNDMTKEKKVLEELNFHIVEDWETFKYHFSFPHKHPIGINTKEKTFENESELKNFIQSDQEAVNMWMDHPWLQAASNLYNTNIHILTTGVENPRWTKLQPSSKFSKASNLGVKDNIYLLHAENSHFDLLVPKINPETLILTDEEQDWMEDQMNLIETDPSEIDILRFELAESKKEI